MTTLQDWVPIIGAIFAGIVLVINAIGVHFGRREARQIAKSQGAKLDTIHELTNGSTVALQAKLDEALEKIRDLEERARNRRQEFKG